MTISKKVTVESLEHRGKNCLAIRFPIDNDLKQQVKTICGATFSITHKCWYVENRENVLSEIFAAFKGHAWVDITVLKTEKVQVYLQSPSPSLPAPALEPYSQKKLTHAHAQRLLEEKLKLKGYSENTIRTYQQQFKDYLLFFPDSNPDQLNESDVRNYLLYLVDRRKMSRSVQNQAINAIKFYYEKVLEHERRVYFLERPLKERRLPEVLSQEEVISYLKH
jgi:integrase/recombinase XerD